MVNFNEVADSKVFNAGAAGIVDNVTAVIEVKTPEDKENATLYKLLVKDANGGLVNNGFWPQEDFKEDWQAISYVKELKHLVSTFNNTEAVYPAFTSYKQALDFCMGKAMEGLRSNSSRKYRVAVDYGSTSSPKKYLQLNGYPQYVEAMDTKGNVAMKKTASLVPLTETAVKETAFGEAPLTNFNLGDFNAGAVQEPRDLGF